MPTRRQALLGGLAALGTAASAARAQGQAALAAPPSPWIAPQVVPIQTGFPADEIHVIPDAFALYWTRADGTAIRYRCGIGRPGLYEAGTVHIDAKAEWPSWTPTPDMIAREPELYPPYAEGIPGGPGNPLGTRALYLFTPELGDTFLRIHGTDAPETIGTAVSNGCARLVNDQIVELYEMVPLGTRVVLYPQGGAPA